MNDLDKITEADLTECTSIQAMAQKEGWDPDRYAINLSESMGRTGVSLDSQRERLAALASIAPALLGDQSAADELARHEKVLTALFHRFAYTASELAAKDTSRYGRAAGAFLDGALKAQRASMLVLGAIKAIRDSQQHATTPLTAPASPRAT